MGFSLLCCGIISVSCARGCGFEYSNPLYFEKTQVSKLATRPLDSDVHSNLFQEKDFGKNIYFLFIIFSKNS